ncbi:secreted EGF-like growth factor [Hypsugopox virus]|nr:secreted EGF-like growth factor [Hypsugopox virus]
MLKKLFIFSLITSTIISTNVYNTEHITPCDNNDYCLNGGFCYITKFAPSYNNKSIKLCFCTSEHFGTRCQYIKNNEKQNKNT